MYTIDLLKGQNLPARKRPAVLIISGIAFCVPVIMAVILFMSYFRDKAALNHYRTQLESLDKKIIDMQKPRLYAESIVDDNVEIKRCLDDVNDALARYAQWSDMLVEIGRRMPRSLIVDGIDVTVRNKNKQVKSKVEKGKMINIRFPSRTMVISMFTYSPGRGDEDVRKLQKAIKSGNAFSRFIEDVIIAVREPDKLEDKDIVRYEVNCMLRNNE